MAPSLGPSLEEQKSGLEIKVHLHAGVNKPRAKHRSEANALYNFHNPFYDDNTDFVSTFEQNRNTKDEVIEELVEEESPTKQSVLQKKMSSTTSMKETVI